MCKRLEDEMRMGENSALDLARHLRGMGAEKCSLPVTLDDERFLVTVERVLDPWQGGPPENTSDQS